MRVVRDVKRLQQLAGCALTIGNFDGLHRGHQAVIEQLNAHASALQVPSALMTFEPMPLEFFRPEQAPARLSSLREKVEDAGAFGIDLFVCARFNRKFAELSADAFLHQLLLERFNPRYVTVGDDFHFGHNREGDIECLHAFGAAHGIQTAPMSAVTVAGERISSTRIRTALAAGDTAAARHLLGRDYRISGRVASGRQLGRTLGFPTANIRMRRRVALRYGVYAVRVTLPDGRVHGGAANIGVRPAVGGDDCLLEVFLLDFDGDLYDRRIDVSFEAFIRAEADFDDLEALTRQMHADVDAVRAVL